MQYSINKKLRNLVFAVVLCFSSVSSVFAFSLDVNFVNGSTFSATQQNTINSAANYWESVITGYQTGISGISQISISADNPYIDGPGDASGNILGQAGYTSTFSEGSYVFSASGMMRFDSYDINTMETNGTLYDVIVHELAHIIGFGTLWEDNGLYTDGSGEYTGAAALAAYQAEFDGSATFIPVELDGGTGTANGHWDESIGANELMTGWLNYPTYISNTTIASFVDLGYTVNLATVPLPAAVWLFGSGLLGLVGWSKRKQAA